MKDRFLRSLKPSVVLAFDLTLASTSAAIAQAPSESPSIYYGSALNLDEHNYRLAFHSPIDIFVCAQDEMPTTLTDDNQMTPDFVRVENADCEVFTALGEALEIEDLTADVELIGEVEIIDLNQLRQEGSIYPVPFESVQDHTIIYE